MTKARGAYTWIVRTLHAGRDPNRDAERWLNSLDQEGWEIVTVVPRDGTLLFIARKPRSEEDGC